MSVAKGKFSDQELVVDVAMAPNGVRYSVTNHGNLYEISPYNVLTKTTLENMISQLATK